VRGIAASLIVHGAALALFTKWIVVRDVSAPVHTAAPIELRPSPAPVPVVVELITLPAESGTDTGASTPASVISRPPALAKIASTASGASAAATRTGATQASAESDTRVAPDTHGEPGPHRSPLAMRGADLSLSDGAIARLEARPTRADLEPPEPPQIDQRLKPSGKGTFQLHDVVTTLTMAPDGTVVFRDKPYIDIHINLPVPTPSQIVAMLKDTGKQIDEWTKDPYRDTRVGKPQDLPARITGIQGACDHWGDPLCDPPPWLTKNEDDGHYNGEIAGGNADLTAYLMHKLGVGDPYASRKLKILDTTRDQRVTLGSAFRTQQLDRSAELTQRNLENLWRTTTDPAARREAVFAIWDECTEGEGEAAAAGDRARAMVIGWIRARMPPGSADAFTADELARLNARKTSHRVFAPYP
jgi:hypothetical protein